MATEADPRKIVESGYDSVAGRYAELEPPEHEWPRMRWLHDLLGRVRPGERVLDVGCGNGIPATRETATLEGRFQAHGGRQAQRKRGRHLQPRQDPLACEEVTRP